MVALTATCHAGDLARFLPGVVPEEWFHMRKYGLMLAAVITAACGAQPDDDKNPGDGDKTGDVVEISQAITEDDVWTADKTYVLKNYVFVKGATLTIEAGTKVLGGAESALVVTSSARLMAEGRADAPIVFTSSKADGERAKGDWGGVLLLGKAPINIDGGVAYAEGFPAGESDDTKYGGSDDTHDCGSLKYARIEFAGFQLAPGNELNGLTVAGCGTDTKLDYIQVHKGADDGIEFFGGTASLRHALITQPDDDGLDWEYGWTGTAQFVVVQQNGVVGDFGIEASNNGDAHDASPRSMPTLWNVSLIGSNKDPGSTKRQGGIHFNRGTGAHVYNAIVSGFADIAIDVGDPATAAVAAAGDLFLKNSILFDNANLDDAFPEDVSDDDGFDDEALFTGEATNRFVDPKFTDAFNLDAPVFTLAANSPALEGGAAPPAGFDTSATFVGAFGTEDWAAGWSAYPAE